MSGVYIPDMEKPKCCFLCPLCYDEITTAKTGYCRLLFEENEAVEGGQMWRIISDVTELADFCPLVAVSDHGRLIDADALTAQGYSLAIMRIDEIDTRVWRELVPFDYAPTIIPADKEADK